MSSLELKCCLGIELHWLPVLWLLALWPFLSFHALPQCKQAAPDFTGKLQLKAFNSEGQLILWPWGIPAVTSDIVFQAVHVVGLEVSVVENLASEVEQADSHVRPKSLGPICQDDAEGDRPGVCTK